MSDAAPIIVRIAVGSHRVEVVAVDGDRADVRVGGGARVDRSDRSVTIDELRDRVVARVPAGPDVVVGTPSGGVGVQGRVGHAAMSASGRVQVESAASVDVRTETSQVALGRPHRRPQRTA